MRMQRGECLVEARDSQTPVFGSCLPESAVYTILLTSLGVSPDFAGGAKVVF